MSKWIVDKDSKVPLYLQLKDLVKYYISTGVIQNNEQLPGVIDLAKELEINFETVRKAYKELEKEGLISMKRGKGTFANGHAGLKSHLKPSMSPQLDLYGVVKSFIRELLHAGIETEAIKAAFGQAIEDAAPENAQDFVIFTECNQLQVNDISDLLKNQLNVNVRGVLLDDLKREVERAATEEKPLLAVVTTGFHVNEVRTAIGDMPVKIDFVVTNMSPETRRELDAFDKTARFGFICRDSESISFYKDMLRAELGIGSELDCCTLKEGPEVGNILTSVNALLVSPPVYEDVKRIAPADLPIFNVFDRVDPMSIRIIRDRIMEAS